MKRLIVSMCMLFASSLIGWGCSTGGESSAAVARDDNGGNGGYQDTGGTADAGVQPPPGEEEETFDLQAPRASRSFVFVANTTLNSIAKIDSLTLDVTPIEVCLEPTEVRTLATMDRAVVLCRGDDQLAVIDAGSGDDNDVAFAWVAENANSLALSPTGDYALAWYDDRIAEPTDEPGNPHDLTLIKLGDRGDVPESYLLSVGFAIRALQFDAAGETAFVTTEDGLNLVGMADIDRDQFLPLLHLGDDPLAQAVDREVLVTDDGALAFVRSSTFAGLRVLDIDTEQLSDIALPAVPTDLDLFPGGERGLAVMRELSTIAVMPLPEAVSDPESIELLEVPGETIGLAQLSLETNQVLLYSTATSTSRLTLLHLSTGAYSVFDLRKNIDGVVMAPSGARAIVFHDKAAGTPVPGEPTEDFVAKSFGYSLFDLESGFARLVLCEADPDAVVYSEDGSDAFVMLEDAARGVNAVQWVDFRSFRVDTLDMVRPPESMGVVPATGRIYVSQLAETGRITFIDTETGHQQHVTAYQLNRRIE